ncbi:IS110 family transposase [Streptomyces sp. Ncost-T10-10d]|uniref:IS110 family transposase n=1 Tax=Streptomyces sp. Ncost-T10-10d TaxID=1839774 RepID=UPI00081DEB6E|nr:IS110 family transposase [Streptomyces sp. Ncost-T10-10d]SCF73636.1 Transposase IS116/IS110/IS902 family protein [Streptomyces sp. Ncost-T10-10d]
MPELWAGTDAGKAEHHCTVIDTDGTKVLSRRVPNNEDELLQLLGDVLDLADGGPVTWAVDLNAGGAALWIALLVNHGQRLFYIPGRTIHHASGAYRGDGKSDAKDAFVIADQARMRRDLQPLQETSEIAVDLKILTARRMDLSADRTRAINRLRAQILEYFPALERAFDYSRSKTALILLTGYQTPAALRRIGRARLSTWLKNHGVRTLSTAKSAADTAVTAAEAQFTVVTGEKTAAKMVHTLAREVMALDEEISELNALIEGRFREHPDAEVITSMPGIGDMLGAEFIAATGGDMTAFGSPDRLAGVAGLAPVPRDSGKVSGNLRRPRRYSRRLLRMFYLSAQVAAVHCPQSKTFYQRKRAEGKSHKQAVLALARRRLNVLWALIRDHRTFEAVTPSPAATAA